MATNTAGITIPILAKIEGWQAELKRILEEAKKVNLGTQFGKDLLKNIAALEKQINSMAQTLTHRLTSDSGIDNFSDKLNEVETRFKVIGDTLSNITLSNLDVSYVDSLLKPLLDKIEALLTLLNTDLDATFSDKIVTEATKVQKAFARIGKSEEDIKNLGREGTRSVLEEMVTSAIKLADEAAEKIKNLLHNIAEFKKAELDWQPTAFAKETNIDSYVSSVISKDPTSYGFLPIINEQALKETKKKIEDSINEIKLSDAKKADIQKYLNDLVPTSSIELIRKRMGSIKLILLNVVGRDAFGLDATSLDGYLNDIFNKIDPSIIDTSLNKIKERFITDGITEEDLNKFWGPFSDAIKNQDFDKAIEIVSTNLTNLLEEYKSGKDKIIAARLELEEALKLILGDLFRAAWTRTFGEDALKELDALIEKYTQASDTAKELQKTKKELEEKKIEILLPTLSVGKSISDDAVKRWYENTSAALVYKSELDLIKSRELMLGKIQGVILRWFSIYAAVRMVSNAIKSVIDTVKELDSTITEIAIVTKMDLNDLWGLMGSYTDLARQYAASISGVYKVSLLYYQQGLLTADVMALTEQTLKMARISGLDYAQATDYMTNAVRSFKMEMTDALNVVDVYSAIAASSATSVTELASAMSKTASSAQAVSSSFENTTAMMAVMIEATRESAENIGSAMKSIISRYGEMTSDPSKLMDSEGEEMSLNRVDKALLTVGISIHNAAGEFRNFDEVVMELALKWDTIDTNTQRYIATIMAGNRQQSRFLALVSSYDRLKELSEEAANSENASLLQFLKTLDSVEAKTQLLLTSLLSLYTASGIEKTYKAILDLGNSVIQTFTNMETISGFPVLAITRLGMTFASLALIVTNVFKVIKTQYSLNLKELEILLSDYLARIKPLKEQEVELERKIAAAKTTELKKELNKQLENVRTHIAQEEKLYKDSTKRRSATKISMTTGLKVGMISSSLGMIGTTIASTLNLDTQRDAKGWTTIGSSIASGIGTATLMGGGPLGIIMGVATSLSGILEGIGILTETIDEKVNKLKSNIENASNAKLQSKDLLKTLTDYKKKYDELSKVLYLSAEDKKAFIDILNEIALSYPELISFIDAEGNYIVNMTDSYLLLAQAKQEAYKEDYIKNIDAELAGLSDIAYIVSAYYGKSLDGSHTALEWFFRGTNNADLIYTKLAAGENITSSVNYRTAMGMFGDIIKNSDKPYEQLDAWTSTQILTDLGNIILKFWDAALQGFTLPLALNWISNLGIYNEYSEEIQSFSSEIYSKFEAEISAIKFLKKRISAYFDKAISEWLNILSDIGLIEETNFLQAIVSLRVQDAWQQYLKEAENGIVTLLDGTTKLVKKIGESYTNSKGEQAIWQPSDLYNEFISQYTAAWYAATIELLNYLLADSIDELYANRGQYTKDLIKSMSAYQKLGKATEEFWKLYDEAYKDIFDRYENFLLEDISFIDNELLLQTLTSFKDLIGPDFLQGIIDLYRKILDNTDLTLSELASQIDTLTAAIQSLQNLSGEDLIKALATLLTADLTSLFGIYKFIEDLNKKDINLDGTGIIEAFRLFSHTLTINLESELNSYGDTISQISEDYSKDLSDATKGMDLKKASEMSKKFSISLADFDYSNNKFFLSNLDIIKSYYLDLYQAYTDALLAEFALQLEGYRNLEGKTWNYHLRTINWDNVFNKNFTLEQLDQKFADLPDMQANFKEETGIEYNDFRNLYEQFLKQDKIGNFFTFLDTYYSDLLEIYSNYFKDLEKDTLKTAAKNYLSVGNIEKFADIIFDGLALKQDLTNFLLEAFKNGDLTNILQFVPADYAQMVAETFKDSIKSVYDSFSLSGDIGTYIISDALNANVLAELELGGLATHLKEEEGNIVYQLATITEENIDTYIEAIKNSNLTSSIKADKLAEAHAFKYKDKISALTTTLSNTSIDYSSAENLAEALGYTVDLAEQAMSDLDFVLDTATGKWRRGANTLEKIEERIDELKGSASLEDLNELLALEDSAIAFSDSEKSTAISDILKNYTSITPQILARFSTAFGKLYDEIKTWIVQDNFDGTFSVDVAGIRELLLTLTLEDSTRNLLEQLLAGISDDYLNSIKSATDYISNGTTKQTDMEKFVLDYNEKVAPEAQISVEDAFKWNDILSSFTLDVGFFDAYSDAIKNALIDAGYDPEWANNYIKGLIKSIDEAPNINDFLSAENKEVGSEAYNKLYLLLYNQFIINPKEGYENATQYATDIITAISEGGIKAANALKIVNPKATESQLATAYSHVFDSWNSAVEQLAETTKGSVVTGLLRKVLNDLNMADSNGVVNETFNMVLAYLEIYNRMRFAAGATTAGLNDAYAKLLTAQDKTNIDITEALKNGNGMSYADFGNLLAKYDISFEEYMTEHYDAVMRDGFGNIRITDWNAFAESIWKDNLDLVKNTLEYTSAFKTYNDGLIELNQNAEDAIVEEIQSISGAKGGDWLNMTALWSGLLSIVSAAISNITPQDYKGNVDLANRPIVPADKMKEVFAGFEDDYATLYSESFMSLDFGDFSKNAGMLFTTISASGEIVGDLYSYVKALYDEAAGDTDRMRELDKVSNGGKGLMLFGELASSYEKLNQYAQDLHDRGAAKDTIGYYLQVLKQYDATLENGILKLGDNANMFGVASTIRDLIDASGIEITNGLAEIQDAIQEVLKSYAEAITKGILGGLTNTEVDDLNAKAKDFGITNLLFTETADGFLLAETSAILLYSALKSIDALHAEQVFDALSESLEKSNEHFKTTGALMAHITSIRKDLYSADDKISNARKALYEAELAVAEEILAVRSTTEDESFKFMDLAIPAGQNNPLNYWEGWLKAFNAINESKKTKRMDYTDFYNLMTEMGNLSTMLGGKGILIGKDLEVNSLNYADLITQAAHNLTSTASDTDLKVNLPAINVDFSSAENMVGDVQKGIQAVADEQINMLDGLIAMLETVVAMEKLGDIAGGGDTPDEIDLGDIFPEITWDENGNAENLEAITAYDKDYLGFLDWIEVQREKNKDLNDALDLLKVNGMSLSDIFGLSAHDLAAKGKEFNQAYVAFLEGMRKAALSGNYDIDNIMASVLQVLAESGITDLTIDTGKSTMIIKGGVVTTLDWETPETQTILAEVDANTEKAKELITQAMENYLAGKASGNKVTLELILKLRHHILINDEGVEYIQVTTPDGKDKVFANDTNENHWLAAQAEKLLEDMGLDPHKLTKKEYNGGYAQTTTTIGDINNIQVRAEGGLVSFNADGSATAEGPDGEQIKLHGSSQLEVINNFVEDYKNKEKKLNISTEKTLSEAEIQWKLGIRASLAATIVNDLGKGIDFANEPLLRKEIQDKVNHGLSEKDFVADNKGNYKVTIGNLQYTVDGASIETDGNLDLAKAAETLLTSTGLDLSLSRTITQGIADAIPSLADALSSLDPNPAQKVADAIKQISDNASSALEKVESLVKKNHELSSNGSNSNDNTVLPEETVYTGEPAPGVLLTPAEAYATQVNIDITGAEAALFGVPNEGTSDIVDGKAEIFSVDISDAEVLLNGDEVKAVEGSSVTITNPITGVPSSLDPLDMTYLEKDLGQQQVEQGTTITVTNAITAFLQEIVPELGDGAWPDTIEIDNHTVSTDSLVTVILEKLLPKDGTTGTSLGTITLASGKTVNINDVITAYLKFIKADASQATISNSSITLPDGVTLPIELAHAIIRELILSLSKGIILSAANNIDIPSDIYSDKTTTIHVKTNLKYSPSDEIPIDGNDLYTAILNAVTESGAPGDLPFVDEIMSLLVYSGLEDPKIYDSVLAYVNKLSDMYNADFTSENFLGDFSSWLELNKDIPPINIPVEPDVDDLEIEDFEEPVTISTELDSDALTDSATEVGLDASNAIATGIESGEKNISNAVGSIRTHITELGDTATVILSTIKDLLAGLLQHVSITGDVEFKTPFGNINGKSGIRGENGKVTIDLVGEEQILEVKDEASKEVTMPIKSDTDEAESAVSKLVGTIQAPTTKPVVLSGDIETLQSLIANASFNAHVNLIPSGGDVVLAATGNIGLAKAKGTLMGELGPELVVSNGRYFVAGLNGAEMVNLADDAIVFNHLQTEQLLKHGMSSGRGKAVTSEKNAVAFATGNTGPAMASASAALAALKQLRAMWESLKGASISDLAGAGGGGGGGGGDKAVDPSIWIDTVERWYNLMLKIAKLEKEITHEETLRSKLESDWNANGNHYYASQKRSLEALRDLIDAQEQLNLSRLAYYDLRVEALEKSPFGKLIRFDDEGQMFFLEGAMEWLTKLAGFDSEGKANYTDEEKYDILMKAGYGDYMKYDSDGGEIKKDSDGDGEVTDDELQTFYGDATKAFWDRIDDYKETTLSLWDSIKDGEDSLLDLQADLNSLLEEIRENQMEVEDEVLKAIEDLRQREIDALQDERDKLEESTLKYIDGLTDALNREQEMYLNLEDETSLNQQRRRLAILQRSGGSAEDIASLRSEIDSSERERYFNLQQQQIDAIQAASDLEIERMDSLIEIMTETLEYQKEYGLLWGNVYAVMQESADKIVSFITNGNSEFWALSPLGTADNVNKTLFKAELWESYRKDLAAVKTSIDGDGTSGGIKENVALMATMTREQMKDNDYSIFDEAMKKEFGNDYDKNGAYKDLFYSEYQEHGDLTKVTASARKKYSDDKKVAEAAKAAVKAVTSTGSGGGSGESGGDGGSSGGSGSGNKKQTYDVYDSRGFKTSYTVEASSKAEAQRLIAEKYGSSYSATTHTNTPSGVTSTSSSEKSYTSSNTTAAQTQNQNTARARLESKGILPNTGTAGSTATATTKTIEQAAKNIVNSGVNFIDNIWKSLVGDKKASGGYVNHGVYELGELGTETVLTASQTKVLRDNILSNRPNSLISLLRSYNENYDGINSPLTGITPVEDNSVTIERVEMTMEVKQIANDYDAKRAGEQALNEMMRIARKTGATNSIRR